MYLSIGVIVATLVVEKAFYFYWDAYYENQLPK